MGEDQPTVVARLSDLAVNLILLTRFPVAVFWGPEGISSVTTLSPRPGSKAPVWARQTGPRGSARRRGGDKFTELLGATDLQTGRARSRAALKTGRGCLLDS